LKTTFESIELPLKSHRQFSCSNLIKSNSLWHCQTTPNTTVKVSKSNIIFHVKQEKGKLKPLDHNFIDLEALMEHETKEFNAFLWQFLT
jgi:hypothetical protein